MFERVCLYDFGDKESSHPELFYKERFVKVFAKFTVKHLFWSLFFQKQPPELFLKISQNSQENTCASVSFNKVVGLKPANFIKKEETLAQVFTCEFREIFKNNFLTVTSGRLLLFS